MQKITRTLTLLGLTLIATASLQGWERKPVNHSKCYADGVSEQRCIMEAEENNEHDFSVLLKTQSFTLYNDFLPEQKTRAMDYADHNEMSPDDAVAKVQAEIGSSNKH